MGIQYFYNFCIREIDDVDLDSDILSAVRKSYFASFEKIRDKITYDSEGISMLYDYCIEKDKPLRWTVKNPQGGVVQEVLPADSGRYYLCFYRGDKLFKRLLFSKLHTLLMAEYMDDNGAVCRSVEPRKVQGGLCLLYKDVSLPDPVVLSAAPDIEDEYVAQCVKSQFRDYTAAASTDTGIVWYLSDKQTARFKALVQEITAALSNMEEVSFVGDDTPLLDKINAKDFNMKRNLSAALDISQAKSFSAPVVQDFVKDQPVEEDKEKAVDSSINEPSEPEVENELSAEEIDKIVEEIDAAVAEPSEIEEEEAIQISQQVEPEEVEQTEETEEQEEIEEAEDSEEKSEVEPVAAKPDKEIMADGAVYSYYGNLDGNGNRSGYGRTVTDFGLTAYEGMYVNDKRSGKGAYFYKDGTLCYSGDWAENVRHGVGVGFSSRDGSIHVGKWVHNKPEGTGVRMSAEGEIKFVCKELSDGSTVLMNYLDDDSVVISKYDKNGSKLSEKKVSLIDLQ